MRRHPIAGAGGRGVIRRGRRGSGVRGRVPGDRGSLHSAGEQRKRGLDRTGRPVRYRCIAGCRTRRRRGKSECGRQAGRIVSRAESERRGWMGETDRQSLAGSQNGVAPARCRRATRTSTKPCSTGPCKPSIPPRTTRRRSKRAVIASAGTGTTASASAFASKTGNRQSSRLPAEARPNDPGCASATCCCRSMGGRWPDFPPRRSTNGCRMTSPGGFVCPCAAPGAPCGSPYSAVTSFRIRSA